LKNAGGDWEDHHWYAVLKDDWRDQDR
jgi:RimJ/RimL family protein N-acetyltransferase